MICHLCFFFQAEDGIRDWSVTGVQTCALPIFACEVACLSLILADYPNHNGWHIGEADLFEQGVLEARMRAHNVILCNPPFEAFTQKDRARYPIAAQTYSKP